MTAKYCATYFAPDIDPSWSVNPGVLIDASDAVPTVRNTLQSYEATTAQALTGLGTFSETTYNCPIWGVAVKGVGPTGVADIVVGTATRLLTNTGSAWADVSPGGTDISVTVSDWDFTTFGNDLIATGVGNSVLKATIQASGCSTFAALTGGPPKARCCTTQKNFVLLADTNDGSGQLRDQIWWSALGNDTSWTASAATQAGNYRLLDTPGGINSLVNLRDAVIAYKDDSIYVGDYQGSPLLWTWRLVSDRVGCSAQHGVAVVNGLHFFVHRTGVYRFDGASVQPIGGQLAKFLYGKVTKQSLYASFQAGHDEFEKCIFWIFGDSIDGGTGVRDQALVYNYVTGQFGFVTNTTIGGNNSSTPPTRCLIRATQSDLTTFSSLTFDSAQSNLLLMATSNIQKGNVGIRTPVYGANAGSMSITTGDIGADTVNTVLKRVTPRYLTPSSVSAMTAYGKPAEGAAFDAGDAASADTTNQRFDITKSARFHKLVVTSTAAELAGLMVISADTGGKE